MQFPHKSLFHRPPLQVHTCASLQTALVYNSGGLVLFFLFIFFLYFPFFLNSEPLASHPQNAPPLALFFLFV